MKARAQGVGHISGTSTLVRRAEVMAEVQRLLILAYDAFGYFRKTFQGYAALVPTDEMMNSAVKASNDFRIYYLSNRQLFTPALAQRLDEVNERLMHTGTVYFKARTVDHKSAEDAYAQAFLTTPLRDPKELLVPVEDEFRRLYGVTD